MKKWNWQRIAQGMGLVMIALALGYCGLSVAGALQDMRKFSGLGFPHFFVYYLKENDFGAALWLLLCVMAEFVLYMTQRKRWLFTGIFVFHGN